MLSFNDCLTLTTDCHGLDSPRQGEALAYSANPNHVFSPVVSITSVVTAVALLLLLS